MQVDTIKHIMERAKLKMLVDAALRGGFSRFSEGITRVGV